MAGVEALESLIIEVRQAQERVTDGMLALTEEVNRLASLAEELGFTAQTVRDSVDDTEWGAE